MNKINTYNISIDEISKNQWRKLLNQFDDASIFQTWTYGAVRRGVDNLSHLVLYKDGKVAGLAQVHIKTLPGLKTGIAYVPWGPVWRKKDAQNDPEIFQAMIRALRAEYVESRGLLLRIKPNIYADDSKQIKKILNNERFQENKDSAEYQTILVDLDPSLDELRKRMKKSWRRTLKKSESFDFTIHEGTKQELYKQFKTIYNEMWQLKRFEQNVDINQFEMMQNDFYECEKMHIIVCHYQGRPVSASILSVMGDTAIGLLAATGHEGRDLNVSYFMEWHTLKWLKQQNVKWYDLHGIDPEKNIGTYRFKAGLGGKEVKFISQYEFSSKMA